MIDIIVTSYNEPKATLKAVTTLLIQLKKREGRIIVVDPFPEVEAFIKKNIKDPRIIFYPDPGEGKSYALNLLFQEYGSQNKDDLFIMTDGDVYVSDNALDEIINLFQDKKIGCVTGHPVALDNRATQFGFWAHLFFEGIHRARTALNRKRSFFECSGYLFAIRKGLILDFPLETSEDSIIPYLIWKKGYRIAYASEASVYVKNPATWEEWLMQKTRNVKAHEQLSILAPDMPRTKSLFNEIKWGAIFALTYAKTPKEYWWLMKAYGARLYLYYRAFKEIKAKKYEDGWRSNESLTTTRTLD
jgi:cellulose synthase/poly-beta-1,6-N-acetylglucosamine synthase-like glycosyltransferase